MGDEEGEAAGDPDLEAEVVPEGETEAVTLQTASLVWVQLIDTAAAVEVQRVQFKHADAPAAGE